MYNPRFPHTLQILREVMDAKGDPKTDADGNIIHEVVPLTCVEMVDNEPLLNADGSFRTYVADSIPFGYRTASESTRKSLEVVSAEYRIACPMFLNEIKTYEYVKLTDYERTFYGRVIKKATFNLGTSIWLDEVKN